MNVTFEDIFINYITNIVPSEKFNFPGIVNDDNLLYEPFKIMVTKALVEYEEINSDKDVPYIYESFRTHVLQRIYFNRGASKIRGGSLLSAGMHHFGIAVDIVNLKDKNGNRVKDPNEIIDWEELDYIALRKIMAAHGLSYLSWELCHFQAIPNSQQDDLRNYMFVRMKEWQSYNGLVADGIVGERTIKKAQERYL